MIKTPAYELSVCYWWSSYCVIALVVSGSWKYHVQFECLIIVAHMKWNDSRITQKEQPGILAKYKCHIYTIYNYTADTRSEELNW